MCCRIDVRGEPRQAEYRSIYLLPSNPRPAEQSTLYRAICAIHLLPSNLRSIAQSQQSTFHTAKPLFMKEPLVLLPTRTQLQIRFSDTDMLGHINNLSYAAYAEIGRAHFFTSLGEDAPWFLMAKMELEFQKEGYMHDELYVTTTVEHLGKTSMTLRQNIVREDNEVIVSTRAILVCIDRASRQKMTIPTHWRIPEAHAQHHQITFESTEAQK